MKDRRRTRERCQEQDDRELFTFLVDLAHQERENESRIRLLTMTGEDKTWHARAIILARRCHRADLAGPLLSEWFYDLAKLLQKPLELSARTYEAYRAYCDKIMKNALIDLITRPSKGFCNRREVPVSVFAMGNEGNKLDSVLEVDGLLRPPVLTKEEELEQEKQRRQKELRLRLIRSPKFKRLGKEVVEKRRPLDNLWSFIRHTPSRLGRGYNSAITRLIRAAN